MPAPSSLPPRPRPLRCLWQRPAAFWLAALVAVHLIWGLLRLPGRVFVRRWQDVQRYHELGPAQFFSSANHLQGAEAIEWVLQNSEPDTVVLWDGQPMGALEFAPTLLAPRLVVAASLCPPDRLHYAGRALARAQLDRHHGAIVLVATRTSLRVEVR